MCDIHMVRCVLINDESLAAGFIPINTQQRLSLHPPPPPPPPPPPGQGKFGSVFCKCICWKERYITMRIYHSFPYINVCQALV